MRCGQSTSIAEQLLSQFLLQQQLEAALHRSSRDGSTANHLRSLARFADAALFRLHRLAEQRAIATALSDVDALLGGLDRLIAKKRDLKQAAMQQLLTGQTRLPGFHGEWEVKRSCGDIAVPLVRAKNVVRTDACQCYAVLKASSVRWIRSTASSNQVVSEASQYSYKVIRRDRDRSTRPTT